MTLVLWDIDHTLIETRGLGEELYKAAFERTTGRDMTRKAEVTGRTELAILAETLKLHGLQPSEEYAADYARELAQQYELNADELRRRGRVLPGAREALAALAGGNDVVQSVLTGNLRAVAITKIKVFGLFEYVDFEVGAYGDDDEDRPKLVAVAQQRAATKFGARFDRRSTVIVGDSPSDVQTGLKGGARVVAVASGGSSPEDLRRAGATSVLDDLVDTSAVLREVIESGPDARTS
jgi:phosphoglycolate phosphatase